MPNFRVTIPFTVKAAPGPNRFQRFCAEVVCANQLEAQKKGLSAFMECTSATGMQGHEIPELSDAFVEESDSRVPGTLEIHTLEFRPGTCCLTLTGALESATALQLDRECYQLQQRGAKQLLVDLGKVHPLGSAGLGVLLNLNDRVDLRLVRVPQKAKKMMSMLGLSTNLTTYETFAEALKD